MSMRALATFWRTLLAIYRLRISKKNPPSQRQRPSKSRNPFLTLLQTSTTFFYRRQEDCMFRPVLFRVSYPFLAIAFLMCVQCLCMAQVPNYPHDPTLIDKIEKGDFMHISDDNNGRMDLLAVLMGASRSHCEMVNPGLIPLVKYVKYLGSDSVTGKYPSQEFELLGLLGAFVSMGDDNNT